MNHFEIKVKKILELLLENDKYMTLEYLAQQVGTSKRSIQNYMHKIETWLSELGMKKIELQKKQGYGIKLLINEEDEAILESHLNIEKFSLYDDGVFRRLEMLKALIFSNDELTIQYFADQFYISRTVILKDIEWVSQWLSKYNLQLFKTQGRGIGIMGSEVSRRNAIAGFFDVYKIREKLLINDLNSSIRLSNEKYLKLKSIYPKIDIMFVCTIIEDAEKKFDFFLTDDYFITLVTHLVIGIARLSSGKNVDESFLPPEAEYSGLERKTAEYIASRIEAYYDLKLPEFERIYICIHLMSYNSFNYVEKNNLNDTIKNIPQKIELLAISLIDYVDAQLGTSFSTDKILFFGILFHLKTSIYRLEENIHIKTITKDEISGRDKGIFNAISKVSNLYEGICNVKPTEEELIALSMHFELSQKRNIKKERALLVCNNGISSGIALYRQITEASPDIEIVDICSSFQLTFKTENGYDFVITTVPLEGVNKPVADISHVSKNEYSAFLEEFMFLKSR